MCIPGKLTPAHYRVTLHVPVALNDGTRLTDDQWSGIESTLLDYFGACDVQMGGYGLWRDKGVTYRDVKRLFSVDVPHENDAHIIRHYADQLRVALAQECVYVTIHPITAYLV